MKITLISPETYDRLKTIQTQYPNLTFQNNGYEYINKKNLTSEEIDAFKEVDTILENHIDRFSEFFNFNLDQKGNLRLRFNYRWDDRFTGVGYILLDELLNGFEPDFELKHKGELIFTGSENGCYFKLQKVQSQSADWAMKYEGYTITPKAS